MLRQRPAVPWFEAISENFLGGRPLEVLERVRADYPVSLHGVSMNLGSADPLDESYLDRLAGLARRIEPALVSDHLCWTGRGGQNLHDLLPLPFTEEALAHVAARVAAAQERLGRRLLVENVSSYVAFRGAEMTEWEFLAELSARTGCGLLLDVNNVHVSAANHGYDARAFLRGLPAGAVGEIHLAGHSQAGGLLIDTHDHPVAAPVWELFAEASRLFGPVPALIERDDRIPPFERLEREAAKARSVREEALAAAPAC